MTADTDQLPHGVFAPTGVDASALAACIRRAEARPEQSSPRQFERLAGIARLELARDLTKGLNHSLQRIAQAIDDLLPDMGGVSIILHDPAERTFVTSASTVPGQRSGMSATRVRSRGATRFIVDNGVGLYVPELQDDPFGANAMLLESGTRSYVGLPVSAGGEAIAVVYALSPRADAFDPEDLELLGVVADHAALVLAASREYDRVVSIARHSEALALATRQVASAADLSGVLEGILGQLAMSVDFDLLVVESTDSALPLPPVAVGPSLELQEAHASAGSAAILDRFEATGRAVEVGATDGPLAGTSLLAVRERTPLDQRDRETLGTLLAVLAIPFRAR